MSDRSWKSYRDEIDEIDAELTRLFIRRFELAVEIGRLKKAAGLPLYDADREAAIVKRSVDAVDGVPEKEAMGSLFEALLMISKSVQQAKMDNG